VLLLVSYRCEPAFAPSRKPGLEGLLLAGTSEQTQRKRSRPNERSDFCLGEVVSTLDGRGRRGHIYAVASIRTAFASNSRIKRPAD
jgi:hypothetical protein